jgi:hypothetical protein
MGTTARRIVYPILKRAGLAFLVQLVGVVLTFTLAADPIVATHAVLYVYYPVALLVWATGVGSSLPDPVFYVLWVPGMGIVCYSLAIGILWTAIRPARVTDRTGKGVRTVFQRIE